MGKILILTNMDVGLYKFRKELIKELLIDNEVYISLPNGEWILSLVDLGCKFLDTPVDRRGVNPFVDFKLIRSYNNMINELEPNLIITYTIKPNIYGGIISRIKNVRYALNITGLGSTFQNNSFLRKLIIFIYKIAAKKANVIFFENEENKQTFLNYNIVSERKACKLNGAGVNLEEYSYYEYPEDKNEIRFLFLGRIMKEKGIDEFLEVAEKIREEYSNVYFDVVGPEEDSYVERLNKLQNKGIVNYYGYQKDVKPFIKKSHCVVLPSYHEGMANTLLEAASIGRPLITSDIPGCREAVVNGKNGYLTDVRDATHLYENLISFIKLDYLKKKSMAIYSREHIKSNFNKKDIVENTVNALKLTW